MLSQLKWSWKPGLLLLPTGSAQELDAETWADTLQHTRETLTAYAENTGRTGEDVNAAAERLVTCAAGLFQYLKIARGMLEAIADQPSGQQSSLSELVGAFPEDLKDLYTEYIKRVFGWVEPTLLPSVIELMQVLGALAAPCSIALLCDIFQSKHARIEEALGAVAVLLDQQQTEGQDSVVRFHSTVLEWLRDGFYQDLEVIFKQQYLVLRQSFFFLFSSCRYGPCSIGWRGCRRGLVGSLRLCSLSLGSDPSLICWTQMCQRTATLCPNFKTSFAKQVQSRWRRRCEDSMPHVYSTYRNAGKLTGDCMGCESMRDMCFEMCIGIYVDICGDMFIDMCIHM